MKQTFVRLTSQIKNFLNMDIATRDRSAKFQLVTTLLLLMAVSCTVLGMFKFFP